MIKFSVAKCKTKAAYSARLNQKGTLNLGLVKKQFETILETPILLVVKVEGVEVIVHNYGELLFKNCQDVGLMERISKEIYEVGCS